MNQTSPISALQQSKNLGFWRFCALASRIILWLIVLCWALFALAWVVLHGIIVPRIDELRPQLEIQATKALGVPVRIGQVAAVAHGMVPSFELKDVVLSDLQGREALRLNRVLTAISPASLLQLNVEQLYIESPNLEIRRNLAGKIFIAGLDLSDKDKTSSGGLDWFFSQPEFLVRNGTVRWVDERPNGIMGVPPPLVLSQVDFVSRNPFNKHLLRLDATPPPEWGERFSLQGAFKQSLLSPDKGKWSDWNGEIYANFKKIDVSHLSRYIQFSSQFGRGVGQMQAWVSLRKAAWTQFTTDLVLSEVDATLGKGLEPLALQSMSGRFFGKQIKSGFEFATQNLKFQTQDGLSWPGGNVFFSQTEPAKTGDKSTASVDSRGEFRADKLDIATLSLIANRLPLGADNHAKLTSLAPKGVIQSIAATWRGNLEALTELNAKGIVTELQIAAQHSKTMLGEGENLHEDLGRPGVRGARVEFDFNLNGGTAKIDVEKGAVDVPGVFEEPVVPVDKLTADVQWLVSPGTNAKAPGEKKIEVKINNLLINNADAQGTGQLTWRTSDPNQAISKRRFPGELDLRATLTRAEASRVWRYLPTGIDKQAREYVRNAVLHGSSNKVDFTIKGDMSDMPSKNPKQGIFRVEAKVNNATVAYVPRQLQSKGELPWPDLHKINGNLLIDRHSLSVKSSSINIVGLPRLQISQADVSIADFSNAQVVVNAKGNGPLAELHGFIVTSPVNNLTSQVLASSKFDGLGDFKFDLALPVANLQNSRVNGTINFLGNDVQITPDTPLLSQTKGTVSFSEKGFDIKEAKAQLFGGEIRFDGGNTSSKSSANSTVIIRGQGEATAAALQNAQNLSVLPNIAKYASGGLNYTAELRFRHGHSELLVQSNLVGMGIDLPAPLNKSSQTAMPLSYSNTLIDKSLQAERDGKTRAKDQVHITLDKLVEFKFIRDVQGETPKLIQGGVGVGLAADESLPEPDSGVAANINVDFIDADQWGAVIAALSGTESKSNQVKNTETTSVQVSSLQEDYTPSIVALRAKALVVQGRRFENIFLGASRVGSTWRANMEAKQLSGYLEYRLPASQNGTGSVYARLARLTVGDTQVKDVEKLLDEQPTTVPALDLIVDDFELKGRKFGRVEVEAVNLASAARRVGKVDREWRLNKFNVTTSEAKFSATGVWMGDANANTRLDFKLDISDAGKLLDLFGIKETVLGGAGRLEGQIAWRGSPLSMNYPSMTGQFNINIEKGQFLKSDPGVGKLLSVLSMQTIMKRLTFDFRDVFSSGFAFDFVRGDVTIARGIASTNNFQMSGVNAVVLIEGQSDVAKETQELRIVIAPEVNAGVASLLVATAINPAIGLGTFLAQLFLRQPLIEAATRELHVKGTWSDPLITEVKHVNKADAKKS
ncbi:MAG: TIGR02099 family protein [Polaromonas sp.]|nr:TIGR02099 family protein [Polaromonas sp.]